MQCLCNAYRPPGWGAAASASFGELSPPLQVAALRLLPVLLAVSGPAMVPLLGGAGRLLGHLLRRLPVAGPAALQTTPYQVNKGWT